LRRHGLVRGERPALLLGRVSVHRPPALLERDVPPMRRRGPALLQQRDARLQLGAALRGELLRPVNLPVRRGDRVAYPVRLTVE